VFIPSSSTCNFAQKTLNTSEHTRTVCATSFNLKAASRQLQIVTNLAASSSFRFKHSFRRSKQTNVSSLLGISWKASVEVAKLAQFISPVILVFPYSLRRPIETHTASQEGHFSKPCLVSMSASFEHKCH
jgi:hypothetical protein